MKSNRRQVGILIKKMTSSEFATNIVPLIEEHMVDPNVVFLVRETDRLVLRLLKAKGYRNYNVFSLDSGFSSIEEIDIEIMTRSNIVIR
jgi:hypothetical protein